MEDTGIIMGSTAIVISEYNLLELEVISNCSNYKCLVIYTYYLHTPTKNVRCDLAGECLTLFLYSALKANWFSGFPSGILYHLNQLMVDSR